MMTKMMLAMQIIIIWWKEERGGGERRFYCIAPPSTDLSHSKPSSSSVTVYIDDLSIDNWSSILRSSILSVSTIYIDDPI